MDKKKAFIFSSRKRTLCAFTRALSGIAVLSAASCTDLRDIPGTGQMSDKVVCFTVTEKAGTRSAELTTSTNIAKMAVWAHYTGASDFSTVTASTTPNFMSGIAVSKGEGGWTYSPLAYWPETTDGTSYGKVSFFAISPAPTTDAGGNGIAASYTTGYPAFTITPASTPSAQLDVCVAQALDQTQETASGSVPFAFAHTLAQITFAACYTGDKPNDAVLKVTGIAISGMKGKGTLTLRTPPSGGEDAFVWSDQTTVVTDAKDTYTLSTGDLSDSALTDQSAVISTSAGTLLLVPQSLANGDVTAVVTISYDADGSGSGTPETSTVTVSLPSAVWKAGTPTQYNLVIPVPGE